MLYLELKALREVWWNSLLFCHLKPSVVGKYCSEECAKITDYSNLNDDCSSAARESEALYCT